MKTAQSGGSAVEFASADFAFRGDWAPDSNDYWTRQYFGPVMRTPIGKARQRRLPSRTSRRKSAHTVTRWCCRVSAIRSAETMPEAKSTPFQVGAHIKRYGTATSQPATRTCLRPRGSDSRPVVRERLRPPRTTMKDRTAVRAASWNPARRSRAGWCAPGPTIAPTKASTTTGAQIARGSCGDPGELSRLAITTTPSRGLAAHA
jgi:hypothetical protein